MPLMSTYNRHFYTLPHDSGGVLWFHVGCPFVPISFLDDNLSKHQWIFTKLGMCIGIVEIWFGIANGQISSNFDSYLLETRPYFPFLDDDLSKYQGILTKLGTCIDIKEIWFGIANGQILPMFDKVICPWHNNGVVL